MKLFCIIPYWLNKESGETRINKRWLYLRAANSFNEINEWAKNHKEEFFFRADNVFKPNEIDETNLNYDFSIQEISDIFVFDLKENEYRVKVEIVSKIEMKKVEIPIDQDDF